MTILVLEEFLTEQRRTVTAMEALAERIDQRLDEKQIQSDAKQQENRDLTKTFVEQANAAFQVLYARAETLIAQKKAVERRIRLKLIALAFATVILPLLVLTYLRPAWSLSLPQHEAWYLGNMILIEYRHATPERQKQMREIMNWREMDTLGTHPSPTPSR